MTVDPASLRRYIEQFFSVSHTAVYWGSPEEFFEELDRTWTATP
jgi:hypothetical protein